MYSGATVQIIKLKEAFYSRTNLKEILDKNRGYGLVTVTINNIQFGIPLRSNLSHSDGFKTKDGKGLDFSKAIIVDANDIDGIFHIPGDEYAHIAKHAHHIEQVFNRYVQRYVNLVKSGATSTINRAYRFTTLVNYHSELGL